MGSDFQTLTQSFLWRKYAPCSHQYPDIATATITGPEAVGDKLVYRFSRAIGSKG